MMLGWMKIRFEMNWSGKRKSGYDTTIVVFTVGEHAGTDGCT